MKKYTLRVSPTWIIKHRSDKDLPIAAIKGDVETKCGYTVLSQTIDSLTIEFDDSVLSDSDVESAIKALFISRFSESEWNDVVTGNFETVSAPASTMTVTGDIVKTTTDGSGVGFGNITKKETVPTDEHKETFDAINDLPGGGEFSELCKEIISIAPQILKTGTKEVIMSRCYLMSINDGHGATEYLSILQKLLSKLKICTFYSKNPIVERKILNNANIQNPFDDALGCLDNPATEAVQIVSLDISEWMNSMNTPEFKGFLTQVEQKLKNSYIVVFRIPFIDKEVLEATRRALSDVLFIKTVSIPPYTEKEILSSAEKEFNKYGFSLEEGSWKYFLERISEEKSDGKFYGMNTIKKVVREILFGKQVLNAASGSESTVITEDEAANICNSAKHNEVSGYDMLSKLVGAEEIRTQIDQIIAHIELSRKSDLIGKPCLHMKFVGNPGTGKTTVARIVGKILKERGVLREGRFFEYSGRDFCGRYIGETAPKTASICRDAYGSVLFIDEAYSLYRGGDNERDFGREALETLIAEMENHRSDLVVIMAGYTDDMETLMQGNAGLESRMPYTIEFKNFTREQLLDILKSMMSKSKYEESIIPAAKEYFDSIPEDVISSKEFSNARFVRNLFERICSKAAMRTQLSGDGEFMLTKDDFDRSVADREFTFIMQKKKNKLGF